MILNIENSLNLDGLRPSFPDLRKFGPTAGTCFRGARPDIEAGRVENVIGLLRNAFQLVDLFSLFKILTADWTSFLLTGVAGDSGFKFTENSDGLSLECLLFSFNPGEKVGDHRHPLPTEEPN